MSNNKSSKNKMAGIAAGVALVASVVPLVKPVIDPLIKLIEEQKKLISVPDLYSKGYPLSVEQAVVILENCGLKATPVKMPIAEADAQYRQCFDCQVIETKPKAKQKVERGSSVMVKYITQDEIDKSQQIFELAEKLKEELSLEKSIKQAERTEQTKRAVSGMIGTVQESIKKVPSVFRKSVKEEKEDNDEQE